MQNAWSSFIIKFHIIQTRNNKNSYDVESVINEMKNTTSYRTTPGKDPSVR